MHPDPFLSRLRGVLWAQIPRILISFAIAAVFVWLLKRGGLPLIPRKAAFASLTRWAVPAYAGCIALGTWFRIHRWVHLLRPIAPEVPERRILAVCLLGIAAILFAPLRLGEAARPYLLARDGKVSFFQGLGAAGAERVVDGLVVMTVSVIALTAAATLSPLPNHLGDIRVPVSAVPHALQIAWLVFVGAFVALLVFRLARDFAHRTTQRLLAPISPRLANFVTDTLERLADGLKVLGSPRDRWHFFGETLFYWALGFGGTWALLRGAGIPATLPQACVSLAVLGLGAIIPAGPGFFGTFQIATYTGLALFFAPAVVLGAGSAVVFISYATQLTISAMAGLLGLVLWRLEARLTDAPAAAAR